MPHTISLLRQVLPEPGGQVNNWFAASIYWLLRTFSAKGLAEVEAAHGLLFKGKSVRFVGWLIG